MYMFHIHIIITFNNENVIFFYHRTKRSLRRFHSPRSLRP